MIDDSQILFREEQRFRQKWLWAIVLASTLIPLGIMLYVAYWQLVRGVQMGNHPASNQDVLLSTTIFSVILLGILWLFHATRLITEVRSNGLFVRYVPFHLRYHNIDLENVESIEARTYKPIGEYGGWGIRYSTRGKAYNVSGNRGVEITYRNGKHLLIGSQQADEFANAVAQLLPGKVK
jgi:hypothetical protein